MVMAALAWNDREAAYAFIERALVRFRYHLGLSRAGKGRVREFLAKVTGYSDSQLSRLIAQQRHTGRIRDHRLRPPARPFATVYTTADAVLLAEVDEAFGQPSGPAIKRILWRQYHVFGDERFERLARISNGHIYNLRGRRAYRSARTTFRATRGAISSIGKRRRPRPEGRPGFVRVDTVHSGDLVGPPPRGPRSESQISPYPPPPPPSISRPADVAPESADVASTHPRPHPARPPAHPPPHHAPRAGRRQCPASTVRPTIEGSTMPT